MVTDRGRSYDAEAPVWGPSSRSAWRTCCARSVRWSRPRQGDGRSFGKRLSVLLREAMDLWSITEARLWTLACRPNG